MSIKKTAVIVLLLMLSLSYTYTVYAQEEATLPADGESTTEGSSSSSTAINKADIDALFGLTGTNINLTPEKPAVEEISDLSDSESVFRRVFNFALSFVGIIAMIMIVIAGYYYITAHGEEDKIGKAKKMILATVIGIIIIIASYTVVATVLTVGPASQGSWEEFVSGLFGGIF